MNTILKLAGFVVAVVTAEVCYQFLTPRRPPQRPQPARHDGLSGTERAYWEAKKRGRAQTLDQYRSNIGHIERNFQAMCAAMRKEESSV